MYSLTLNQKINFNTLTSKYFILALILMLVNDIYLKSTFSNFITGKLSDFAWLFAVPFFISTFLPLFRKGIYIFSSLFFIFWKLEISESFIQSISKITHTGFHRTVDITDLIALTIVPLSYLYFKTKVSETEMVKVSFYFKPLILTLFCLAMMADKQPIERYAEEEKDTFNSLSTETEDFYLKIDKKYLIKLNKADELYSNLNEVQTSEDKETIISFEIPKYNATINTAINLEKDANGYITILLKNIESIQITRTNNYETNLKVCKTLTPKDFEKLFRENVIEEIIKNGGLDSALFYMH